MAVYTAPGVYIEELPPSSSPITGVSLSTAAFIGIVPVVPFTYDTTKSPATITAPPATGTTATANLLIPVGLKSITTSSATPPVTTRNYVALPLLLPTDQLVRHYTSYIQFTKDFGDQFADMTVPGTITVADTNFFSATSVPTSLKVALDGWRALARAVHGFFSNGGTDCYVVLVTSSALSQTVVDSLKFIDSISIVAVTGLPLDDAVASSTTSTTASASQTTVTAWQNALTAHCVAMKYRFAVLDGLPSTAGTVTAIQGNTGNSDHAALYYPRLKVFDAIENLINPASNGILTVAPSGYVAGVYARVDGSRGTYKAPANEVIQGVLDVETKVDSSAQGALNPSGINVIRPINGNIRIWGARTLGGDINASFKYVSVRRYFSYLAN